MSNDIVIGPDNGFGPDKYKLERLARFSSPVVEHLSRFLLANERSKELDGICEEMIEVFRALQSSPYIDINHWYENGIIRRIHEKFCEGKETYEETSMRIIPQIQAVQEARQINEVREQVNYLRNGFYEISQSIRSELEEPSEKVFS